MESDYSQGFSIREYSRKRRSVVELRKCWPFSGEITVDLIQSLLPPITVVKFRWWSHELASLLAKPPMTVDDSDPSSYNAKSRPCKNPSVVEIPPQIQLVRKEDDGDDDPYVLIGSKRKRTKDFGVNKKIKSTEKFANKIQVDDRCSEQAREKVDGGNKERCPGVISLSSKKAGSVSKHQDSKLKTPGILKAKRKVCSSPDKSKVYALQGERRVKFSDQSGNVASLELCCLEMNRLNLLSSKDQSSVNDKQTKVMRSDQNIADMPIESRQQNKYRSAVSERHYSHARAKPDLSCFSGSHFSSQEGVKDGLDLRRTGDVAQPIQSFSSASCETTHRSCSNFSQSASADLHWETFLCQPPLDPLLREAISGFPLNSQSEQVETIGEGCGSFNRSSLGTVSTQSASTRNDILLGNVMKQSTERAVVKDGVDRFPAYSEKRQFPARLGVDETFTEKASFISDTNKDPEFGQTVYSPVCEVNPRSHRINLPQQNGLNQNLSIRHVVENSNGLCLQNTRATMRLMGKNVYVGTRYSDMVQTGGRIIAPDASFLDTHTRQSWLWRRPAVGFSASHSRIASDTNWNRALLSDTSKDPFPLFCDPLHVSLVSQARTTVIPEPELPPKILNPCCSLASFPMSDQNLGFYGSGQANCLAFSQQQLPFPFKPHIGVLPSDYSTIGNGLLPDARTPSFRLPFFTQILLDNHSLIGQSSFESSRSGNVFHQS